MDRDRLLSRCWRPPAVPMLVALALTAGGCIPPGGTMKVGEPPPIRTDRRQYAVGSAPGTGEQVVTVVATFQNRTRGTVHLADCQDRPPLYWLERKSGGEWVRAYDPLCWPRAPERLQIVGPGQMRTDTLVIRHFAGGQPSFRGGEIAGTYRLVYEAYASYDPGRSPSSEPLPPELVRSNEFEIMP